jgi:hypothetical protein
MYLGNLYSVVNWALRFFPAKLVSVVAIFLEFLFCSVIQSTSTNLLRDKRAVSFLYFFVSSSCFFFGEMYYCYVSTFAVAIFFPRIMLAKEIQFAPADDISR